MVPRRTFKFYRIGPIGKCCRFTAAAVWALMTAGEAGAGLAAAEVLTVCCWLEERWRVV